MTTLEWSSYMGQGPTFKAIFLGEVKGQDQNWQSKFLTPVTGGRIESMGTPLNLFVYLFVFIHDLYFQDSDYEPITSKKARRKVSKRMNTSGGAFVRIGHV